MTLDASFNPAHSAFSTAKPKIPTALSSYPTIAPHFGEASQPDTYVRQEFSDWNDVLNRIQTAQRKAGKQIGPKKPYPFYDVYNPALVRNVWEFVNPGIQKAIGLEVRIDPASVETLKQTINKYPSVLMINHTDAIDFSVMIELLRRAGCMKAPMLASTELNTFNGLINVRSGLIEHIRGNVTDDVWRQMEAVLDKPGAPLIMYPEFDLKFRYDKLINPQDGTARLAIKKTLQNPKKPVHVIPVTFQYHLKSDVDAILRNSVYNLERRLGIPTDENLSYEQRMRALVNTVISDQTTVGHPLRDWHRRLQHVSKSENGSIQWDSSRFVDREFGLNPDAPFCKEKVDDFREKVLRSLEAKYARFIPAARKKNELRALQIYGIVDALYYQQFPKDTYGPVPPDPNALRRALNRVGVHVQSQSGQIIHGIADPSIEALRSIQNARAAHDAPGVDASKGFLSRALDAFKQYKLHQHMDTPTAAELKHDHLLADMAFSLLEDMPPALFDQTGEQKLTRNDMLSLVGNLEVYLYTLGGANIAWTGAVGHAVTEFSNEWPLLGTLLNRDVTIHIGEPVNTQAWIDEQRNFDRDMWLVDKPNESQKNAQRIDAGIMLEPIFQQMEERLKDTGAPGYPKPANEYPPRKTRQEILNELPGNVASTAGRVSGAVRNAFKPKPPVEPEPVDPWLSRTQPTGDNPTRHRSFKDSINAHHGFQRARRKAREQQLKEQAAQEPNSEGQS